MSAAAQLEQPPFTVVCRSDDRPAWLAARMTGIGASDMPACLGVNRYMSELELYLLKTGQVAREDDDSEAAQWGHELEEKILGAFGRRTGRKVQKTGTLLRSTRWPWMLCTLDGWQYVPGRARAVPVECKLTGAFGRDWDKGVPEYFMPQIQQQMICTDSDMASFAVLINGTRLVYADVERDEPLCARIIEAGERFWSAVQGVEGAPLPDGSESAGWALSKLYSNADPKEVAILDWTAAELSDEYDRLVAQGKEVEREQKRIKQLVQQQMGTAEVALLPGLHGGWTWKTQTRSAYTVTVEESTFRSMLRKKAKADK